MANNRHEPNSMAVWPSSNQLYGLDLTVNSKKWYCIYTQGPLID